MTGTDGRLLLNGVPKVEFYSGGPRCPEDITFPSVMRAVCSYLGRAEYGCRHEASGPGTCATRCGYSYFIGISGIASFLNWKPGWEMDNVEISYMSDDPEVPFRSVFEALGYGYRIMGVGDGFEACRAAITAGIGEGNPVVAFGPVGPPEAALVTGYDENGDVLIGWNFFQNIPDFNAGLEFEPTGEFRKRNWFSYEPGFTFILIEGRKEIPPMKTVLANAIERLIRVARTPVTCGNRANGLAAYEAWASELLAEKTFPDSEAERRTRYDVHNNVVGFLAEARWYGSVFLSGLIDHVDTFVNRNTVEDLLHAAALYAGIHEVMWNVWDAVGGIMNPRARENFSGFECRSAIASLIREAARKDEEAVRRLESALEKMGR